MQTNKTVFKTFWLGGENQRPVWDFIQSAANLVQLFTLQILGLKGPFFDYRKCKKGILYIFPTNIFSFLWFWYFAELILEVYIKD